MTFKNGRKPYLNPVYLAAISLPDALDPTTHHFLYEGDDYREPLERASRSHPLCQIKICKAFAVFLHNSLGVPPKPTPEEMKQFLATHPRTNKKRTPKGQRTEPNPVPDLHMPGLLQPVYDQLLFIQNHAHLFDEEAIEFHRNISPSIARQKHPISAAKRSKTYLRTRNALTGARR